MEFLQTEGIWVTESAALLGGFLIAFILARSLVIDLSSVLLRERRIVCGCGQAGTAYDYQHLFSKNPRHVFIVAQNMRTLLDDMDYLPTITAWLERMERRKKRPHLTLILSTPTVLRALDSVAYAHFKKSVKEVVDFREKEPLMKDKITLRFHPGATSLSAIVCDPESKRRGILVFTPKWALDTQPTNRLYCVVERWEYEDLFNRIAGTIPRMAQSDNDSLSLDDVCAEIGI